MHCFDIINIIFLVLISNQISVICAISFTNWNYFLPDKLPFKTIVGISLYKCITECGKRQCCEYVGYNRYTNMCQLYPSSDTFYRIESRSGIVIGKKDIDNTLVPNDCACNEDQVCDTSTCSNKECHQLSLNNVGFLGNANDVGSQLVVYCGIGFIEASNISSIQCRTSGDWSHTPSCISTTVCTDISTLNGNLIGTGNDVGAVRTVVCNTGYEERSNITMITCEISGNWSYNPICNVINVCSNFTLLNGYFTGTGYNVGSSRTIVCNTGFQEASGVKTITCESEGKWTYIPECKLNCPSSNGYYRDGFAVNIFLTASFTRDEAVSKCSSKGGKLVKIDKGWKMEFLNEILTACSAYSGCDDYWTDGRPVNGKYRFADNTLVPMTENVFWFKDKPDDYENKDCARLTKENGEYLFDDRDCTKLMNYICEY